MDALAVSDCIGGGIEQRDPMRRGSGAAGCVCFGLLAIICSFPLLWWNEGRAAQTWASIDEASSQVVALPCRPCGPSHETLGAAADDAATNRRLVHLSCDVCGTPKLQDEHFPVEASQGFPNRAPS